MPRLQDSAGGLTIGVSETSKVFFVGAGLWHIYIGGTPSTSTLTLQCCHKKDGTFVTYVADNAAGTPTNQAFSSTQVASSSVKYHRAFIDHGMFFRFSADASGTPAWEVDVNGTYLQIYDS